MTPSNLYAHRAPTPCSGAPNHALTSATANQRKRGYVWRTEARTARPTNPSTGRPYRAHAQPRKRSQLDDIHAAWTKDN